MESIAIERKRDSGSAALPIHREIGIAALLDEFAHGVAVTGFDGRLVFANRTARDEFASGTCVLLGLDGIIRAKCAVAERELKNAIQRSAQGRRSLIHLGADAAALKSAVVLPLRDGAGDALNCAIVFSRPSACDALMLGYFARRHGLTPTEEQVLAALSGGLSAPEAAARMHVAVSTIRSHVRSICAKTRSRGVRQVLQRVVVLPSVGSARLGQVVH